MAEEEVRDEGGSMAEESLAEEVAGATESLRPVELGGQRYQLPADVARAFTAGQAELAELRQMVQALGEAGRAQQTRWEALQQSLAVAAGVEPSQVDDPDTRFLRQPMAALQAELRKFRDEILQETRRSQSLESFWQKVYAEYPGLVGFEWVVDSVVRDYPDINELTLPEARAKIGELAMARVEKLPGGRGASRGARQADQGWQGEGLGGGRSSRRVAGGESQDDTGSEAPVTSLTEISKRRWAARDAARMRVPVHQAAPQSQQTRR